MKPAAPPERAAAVTPLSRVCLATFWGSVSGGTFWSAIFFVTARVYGASPVGNLALAAAMGFAYAAWACLAAPLTRQLERWLSPRSVILLGFGAWGFCAIGPLLRPASLPLFWACALGGTAASAVVWPIVESFMSAGRHGANMRVAIGWFNLAWTLGVAAPMLLMPALASVHVLLPIASCAAFNLVAMGLVLRFARVPAHHDDALSRESMGHNYQQLRQATLWLLPLSYVLAAVLSPLMPTRLAALGVTSPAAPAWAATWMLSRVVTLWLMSQTAFWRGRWALLSAGSGCLLVGVMGVLLSPGLPLFVMALAAFGAGMAMVYYAALYYGLAVGRAQVEAGGTFEGLVGLGYCIGPLLGLAGFAVGEGKDAERVTLLLLWLTAAFALRGPWRAYRRSRGAVGTSR